MTTDSARGYVHPEALVSTEWLAAHLDDRNVRVVDATYHLPTVKRDPRAEYEAAHIPGAMFYDIDGIADPGSTLPHMLPGPAEFARAMEALGIGDDTMVVAYDTYGIATSPRAWWSLRAFGHDRVAVLDGGLAKWKAEGRGVSGERVIASPAHFTPRARPDFVRAQAQLIANLTSRGEQVVDARSPGRFVGTEAEPRPGLRGGRIPGSHNVPATRILDPATKTVLPAAQLVALFKNAGLDTQQPIVASCGSGVSACALALGLHLIGAEKVAVYDGSWSEWGRPGATPVATGEP
jgi:thiosulfate/3-mercaptopyruvate sulfurtransferase